MGRYLEVGLAYAIGGNEREMGRKAALEARSQLKSFEPSLAMVFVAAELDVEKVNHGVFEVLEDCPTIGTSTAGEICNDPIQNGVVVAVLASRYLRVRVGMGHDVGSDFRAAVRQALGQAGVLDYFDSGHPFHHMMSISAPGIPGVSSALMIVFSPGATQRQPSLSHDIHTYLRRYSANRIPIFGGSSADYMSHETNCQIVNGVVATDSIGLAFIESEVLFGLGLAHGLSPTTKGALITRASDHIVYELDGRPAAEVCSEILGIPIDGLRERVVSLSRFPFGSTDVYGNSILQVPERLLDDGGIQFAPLMNTAQVITMMSGTDQEIAQAALSAYKKAVRQAGLRKPAMAFMFSCALRKTLMADERDEIEPIRNYTGIPLCGFYTFGEKGLSDDGLPVYCNLSVSMLVFSDELNPVAALINKGTEAYAEFSKELHNKEKQIRALGKINQMLEDTTETQRLLRLLSNELAELLPWAEIGLYVPADIAGTYCLASSRSFQKNPHPSPLPQGEGASGLRPFRIEKSITNRSTSSQGGTFPQAVSDEEPMIGYFPIRVEGMGKRFGLMLLKNRAESPPDEDDLVFAQTIARMTAGALHNSELDAQVDLKLKHLAILNQVGRELATAVSQKSPAHHMLAYLREVLTLSSASLWLIDQSGHTLVKDAFAASEIHRPNSIITSNDERIARWQMKTGEPLFSDPVDGDCPVDLLSPFPFRFASIPVQSRGQLRGILNFYSAKGEKGLFRKNQIFETMDLLTTLSAQIAVFLENLSLQKHATLYKEVHHRIKNNLHNIAGLLRMQIRRLDRKSAEQALNDSIARIVSIAKVHETLSQGDIGMIDLGDLVSDVSALSLSDGQGNSVVSIDVSGSHILVPSKEATSVALVINELVQNAVKHGLSEAGEGTLSIRLNHAEGMVTLVVVDDGPGLTEGFDLERDGNLGLTIVNSLVKEELRGEFVIEGTDGTTATVCFPFPVDHEMQGG